MMNSCERLLAALDHQEPDCVPFDLGSTQVTGIYVVAYRRTDMPAFYADWFVNRNRLARSKHRSSMSRVGGPPDSERVK